MVSRVPDASRGRRVAQSDGLVCLIILSADGHPKPKRSTWSRASAFPTAPNSRLPPKNLHLLFAPFFKGKSKSSRKQKNKKTKKKGTAYFFKIQKLTGFSGEFFYLSK